MASSSLIFVGISLGVFASMTGTIGKQLLRFSEIQKKSGNAHVGKVALMVGLALNTAVGPIVDMLSYMFAPQSLIAPLGGLDVVWNTLIAPYTLGEKLTPSILVGVALIAGGATATSFFGNHDDKDYTIDLLKDIFIRPVVAIYLGTLFLWLVFNVCALQPRKPLATGEPDPIRGLSLGLTAGSIAGNMFCVKAFIELVQTSIRDSDGDVWAHWLPYTLLVGAIFFAVSNLYFLTKAMREYEALFMGAVFEGSLIVCACVSGIVVFSDLEALKTYQIVIYFMALSGMVIGILVVALASSKEEDDDEAKVAPDDDEANVAPDDSEAKVVPVVEDNSSPGGMTVIGSITINERNSTTEVENQAGGTEPNAAVQSPAHLQIPPSPANQNEANRERLESVASQSSVPETPAGNRGRLKSTGSVTSRLSMATMCSKRRDRVNTVDSTAPFPGTSTLVLDRLLSTRSMRATSIDSKSVEQVVGKET